MITTVNITAYTGMFNGTPREVIEQLAADKGHDSLVWVEETDYGVWFGIPQADMEAVGEDWLLEILSGFTTRELNHGSAIWDHREDWNGYTLELSYQTFKYYLIYGPEPREYHLKTLYLHR
jgi:hypothetical protein